MASKVVFISNCPFFWYEWRVADLRKGNPRVAGGRKVSGPDMNQDSGTSIQNSFFQPPSSMMGGFLL